MNNKNIAALFIVSTLTLANSSFGFEGGLSVGVGMSNTDNVNQEVDNEVSDTELALTLGADIQDSSQNSTLDINYQLRESQYLSDSFGDRSSANGYGRLDVFTGDRTFGWFISNDEQDTLLDVADADTPDNRSQRSTMRTGPIVNIRIDPRDTLRLSHIYSKSVIGDSQANSEINSTGIDWIHLVSSRTSVTASILSSTVEPDMFVLNQYEQQNATVGLERRLKYGEFAIKVGHAKIDEPLSVDGDDPDSSIYSVDLNLAGQLGSLTLSSVKQLQSSGENGFLSETELDIGSQAFALEISKRTQASASVPFHHGKSEIVLTYSDLVSENVTTGSVREVTSQSINLIRNLLYNQTLRLSFNVSERGEANASMERESLQLVYNKRLGDALNVGCGVARDVRTFAVGNDEAVSNRGFCNLSYRIR